MRPSALVTGGAGYIGAHVVGALRAAGWRATVLDDLSTGRRYAVPDDVRFVIGDVGDRPLLDAVLREARPQAVLHLAGSTSAPESVAAPLRFYANNVEKSRVLIEAVLTCAEPPGLLFSSSAAVYGAPAETRVSERDATLPINPYGASKLMTERMLADAARAHGLRHVALRYFNVAGCGAAGRGQRAGAPGSLLDVALEAARGERPFVPIYGLDHPTRDGSGVRDFIDVEDLADAHLAALALLGRQDAPRVLNCGYGHGASVLEVLAAVEAACGRPLRREVQPARPSDPPEVVADNRLILASTPWRPRRDDLRATVAQAFTATAGAFAVERPGGSAEAPPRPLRQGRPPAVA